MGLLSGKFLRDVAIGAGEAYLDKRRVARENIVTFQERAMNKKQELEDKFQEGYKLRQAKVQAFKQLGTEVGEDYLPQLNSFIMGGGDIVSLVEKDKQEIIDKIKDVKVDPNVSPTSYIEGMQQENKLAEESINKNLQDYLGIFDNTASVFTKDIVTKGVEGIKLDTGDITAPPIDTDFEAGKTVLDSKIPSYNDFRRDQLLKSEYLMTIPPEKSEQILRQTYNTIYGIDATISENQDNVNQTVNNENLDIGVDEFLETEEVGTEETQTNFPRGSIPTTINKQSGVDTTSEASKKAVEARGL
tara:strand:+ start:862 stop:1767 length:906 start_codon:yes stop_codon:yes gene_type:complete